MSKNYNVSLDQKKFSDYEITKYELEYGVTIKQKDNKTYFKGSDKQIEKVKGMIRKDIFLENNPMPKVKARPGSLSSQLNQLEFKPKYGSIYGGKRGSDDIFKPREFVFH